MVMSDSAVIGNRIHKSRRLFDFELVPLADPVRYFSPDEFDSKDGSGGGEQMVESLIRGLDAARAIAGVPFEIESGYRSPAHNAAVGGAEHSGHVTWEAADIKARTPQLRYRILKALLLAGFDRIEVKPGDIHVDVAHDERHPANIVLFKDTKTGTLV